MYGLIELIDVRNVRLVLSMFILCWNDVCIVWWVLLSMRFGLLRCFFFVFRNLCIFDLKICLSVLIVWWLFVVF